MDFLAEKDWKLASEVASEKYPKDYHMEKLHFAKGFSYCLHMIRQKFLVVDFIGGKDAGEADKESHGKISS